MSSFAWALGGLEAGTDRGHTQDSMGAEDRVEEESVNIGTKADRDYLASFSGKTLDELSLPLSSDYNFDVYKGTDDTVSLYGPLTVRQYTVPVQITLDRHFPNSRPRSRIVKQNNLIIKPNHAVNLDGTIQLAYLDGWRSSTHTLKGFIREIQELFGKSPVVYFKPTAAAVEQQPIVTTPQDEHNLERMNRGLNSRLSNVKSKHETAYRERTDLVQEMSRIDERIARLEESLAQERASRKKCEERFKQIAVVEEESSQEEQSLIKWKDQLSKLIGGWTMSEVPRLETLNTEQLSSMIEASEMFDGTENIIRREGIDGRKLFQMKSGQLQSLGIQGEYLVRLNEIVDAALPLRRDVNRWSSVDLNRWLIYNGIRERTANLLSNNEIDGGQFINLTQNRFESMGITDFHEKTTLRNLIEKLRSFLQPTQAPATRNLPDAFYCPITCEVMVDPVIATDGHTYERWAIEDWLRRSDTSPLTNLKLRGKDLVPNYALRQLMQEKQ
ncbi:WD repeat, SAM and U-box domain-containing protein 1-like [Planoprotostelium fungivorum]|uniref:WD repeat, SAM and U-box domain-containing protein 1-like n=1 Tax=Planoprotostelium fungivorum TaxID=1890364 RepID=A0A2P6N4E4_9EUKA|nr:WD repeat, SAM and U-box domain-containing protein 1-like [Planoprotostelium fungivorum]